MIRTNIKKHSVRSNLWLKTSQMETWVSHTYTNSWSKAIFFNLQNLFYSHYNSFLF